MSELFTEPPAETKSKETEVVERVAELVFKSFQYSQGNQSFQDTLFAYIHTDQPDLQLTPAQVQKIKLLATQKIYKRFKKHYQLEQADDNMYLNDPKHPPLLNPGFDSEVGRVIETVEKYFLKNSKSRLLNKAKLVFTSLMKGEKPLQTIEKNRSDLIELLAKQLINTDLKFLLIRPEGRGHSSDLDKNKRYESWFSYVEALLHNELHENQPDLKNMLNHIRTYIIEKIKSGEYNPTLTIDLQATQETILKTHTWPTPAISFAALVKQWEVKHPGKRFL